MPKKNPSDRILALRAFIASQEDRLSKIKSVQTIKANIEASRKEVETLEIAEAERKKEEQIEAAKSEAAQKRKDDKRFKILLGVGLQSLDPVETAYTRSKILEVLTERDREWIMKYAAKYKTALLDPKLAESSPRTKATPSVPTTQTDPSAAAVIRVLGQFDPATRSHIEGEFLSCSEGEDRRLLEVFFARFGPRSQPGASKQGPSV